MAYSAPDIVARVKGGEGPAGLFSAHDAAEKLARKHAELADKIRRLDGMMASSWTGNAADQARVGAAPLVAASEVSGEHLANAQRLYNGQGDSFAALKAKVEQNDPGSKPESSWWSDNVPVLSSQDEKIAEWNEKAQRVVDGYNAYHSESSTNSAQWPTQYGALGLPPGGAGVVVQPAEPGTGGASGQTQGFGDTGHAAHTGDSGSSAHRNSGAPASFTAGPGSGYQVPAAGHASPTSPSGWTTPSDAGTVPPGVRPQVPAFPQPAPGVSPGIGWGQGGVSFGPGGGFGPGGPGTPGGGRAGFGPGGSGAGSSGPLAPGRGVGAGLPGEPGPVRGGAAPGGSSGAGRGGMGGPMAGAGAGRGQGAEDTEHERPAYLVEHDPDDALVGELPKAYPPVIGG